MLTEKVYLYSGKNFLSRVGTNPSVSGNSKHPRLQVSSGTELQQLISSCMRHSGFITRNRVTTKIEISRILKVRNTNLPLREAAGELFWVRRENTLSLLALLGGGELGGDGSGVCSLRMANKIKYEIDRSSKLRDNNERKNTLVTRTCVLSDAWFRDLKSNSEVSK